MRSLLLACAAATALLLCGCDAVTAAVDKYNPLVSFETRCARLPPSRIEVRQHAIEIVTDYDLPYHELTRLSEDNPATHRTLGLTKTEFRETAQIEIQGLRDRRSGRACSRPQIGLELTMEPMTVYVARELRNNRCARDAVLEHEMKHVAAFREHMAKTARVLDATLPRLFGQRLIFAGDEVAAEAQVRGELQAFLTEFTASNARELKERQAAVDTPEEYARVNGACGGIRIE